VHENIAAIDRASTVFFLVPCMFFPRMNGLSG